MPATRRCVLLVGLAVLCVCASAQAAFVGPELWWYDSTNMQVQANVDALKARMDTAAAAGYTGVVLSDFKLALATYDPSLYTPKLAQVTQYAAQKGLKVTVGSFPFGYSEAVLRYDKNLAEGIAVNGENFTVAPDGKSLIFNPQSPAVNNTSFDLGSGSTSMTGWSLDSGRAYRDTTIARTGTASLKIAAGGGRGYGIQTLTVTPNRQVHVSVWVKTQGLSNTDLHIKLYDATKARQRDFTYDAFPVQSTQGWTQYDIVANTNSSTQLQLRLGTWGNSTGTAWFDDVQVQEVPLHNLVKAPGSPLKIYRPDGTVLSEGLDVDAVTDPNGFANGSFSVYHTPPTVTISNTNTHLLPGEAVKMDYYAVSPIYEYQNGASLTEQGVLDYMQSNLNSIRANFAAGTGVMMGYDEMRQMNSTKGAKDMNMTAGQLLAWHVAQTTSMIRAADGTAPLFTWSDMFDPNHNAVDNYYLVDGTIAGSWAGLPRYVTMMNWRRTAASLQFFAGLGNPQIISGYYDSGNGAAAATSELATAGTIAGIRGLMYTTWNSDYSQMVAYANAARTAWRPHLAGDADFSGVVDAGDYAAWFNNYGTGTMWEQGDFNGDAAVDAADYATWFNNYGQGSSAPVPEPATLALLALGGAMMLKRGINALRH